MINLFKKNTVKFFWSPFLFYYLYIWKREEWIGGKEKKNDKISISFVSPASSQSLIYQRVSFFLTQRNKVPLREYVLGIGLVVPRLVCSFQHASCLSVCSSLIDHTDHSSCHVVVKDEDSAWIVNVDREACRAPHVCLARETTVEIVVRRLRTTPAGKARLRFLFCPPSPPAMIRHQRLPGRKKPSDLRFRFVLKAAGKIYKRKRWNTARRLSAREPSRQRKPCRQHQRKIGASPDLWSLAGFACRKTVSPHPYFHSLSLREHGKLLLLAAISNYRVATWWAAACAGLTIFQNNLPRLNAYCLRYYLSILVYRTSK